MRKNLIPFAFRDLSGEVFDEYGDGLGKMSDDVVYPLMSQLLGGIDNTEEMTKTLGVQYFA